MGVLPHLNYLTDKKQKYTLANKLNKELLLYAETLYIQDGIRTHNLALNRGVFNPVKLPVSWSA